MSDIDSIGPFGNPDGARAELANVLEDYVDFDGDPTFGALATRADDAGVRIVAGKLGAGKTVHLRRLQEFQGRQDSVYADSPQQGLPSTEEIVKVCQWFPHDVLEEKWILLWNRAILRSLTTHLLRGKDLRPHVLDEVAEEIETNYEDLVGEFRRPRSIYSSLREMINDAHTAHHLTKYLNNPLWDDLEDILAEAIRRCPPIFFYLDGIDDEFSFAPMYWLQCQKGLFHQVMRLLRDPKLGGRLHVVVSIRDVVMSAVLQSEHAPKFIGEPHIRLLTWDREALAVLLEHKLASLDESCFVGDLSDGKTINTWLGRVKIYNEARKVTEDVVDYILRHTRLIPRDLVSIGNAICTETRRRRVAGAVDISEERLREIVAQSARRFGDSQLAQCSNQIASDMMPGDAARHEFTQVYTGTQAYVKHISDDLRSMIKAVGVDRFGRSELSSLRALADEQWDANTDLPAVLWQNGLLGCVLPSGRSMFYGLGSSDQFTIPDGPETFVFHPCVIDSVGIASLDDRPVFPY
jgi:hypothetical protein